MPVAMITGASSGIGAEFARQLARRDYDLILVARREDKLRELADSLPVVCQIAPADLSDGADVSKLVRRLAERDVDLLVNNAGFGSLGYFHQLPIEHEWRMHEVHVTATLRLTHAALGPMVKRCSGGIINVASVSAFGRTPQTASYNATKSWMYAFSEGLALEMKALRCGVSVQVLCPGFTMSEFHDTMHLDRAKLAPKWLWMTAEQVVARSLKGFDRGEVFVIPGWHYRLGSAVMTKLPSRVRFWLEGRRRS
ncbi:MAG: SDR family oxidoreductase [Bryobacteraceae bacterium]